MRRSRCVSVDRARALSAQYLRIADGEKNRRPVAAREPDLERQLGADPGWLAHGERQWRERRGAHRRMSKKAERRKSRKYRRVITPRRRRAKTL